MLRRPPTRPAIYWDAFKASLKQAAEDNLALISAGVAFFAMLSLFPALAALIALLGLISDPVVVVAQLEEVRGLLPDDVYDIINTQVTGLVTARADTLGWAGIVSLLVALWSARAGVGAMVIGLNAVYNERNRNAAKHYLHALLLTVSLVAVGIVALLAVVIAPIILAFIPLGPFGNAVADLLRWTVATVVCLPGLGCSTALARTGGQRGCRGSAAGRFWRCCLGRCFPSVFPIMWPISAITIRSTARSGR